MKMPGEADPLYVGARRVLLDALTALQPHLESLVLVGAQAIYLHCGEADFAVSPYTKDADLLIDPETLSNEPDICRAMEAAGFIRGSQPGVWIGGHSVPVDLLVPDSLGGTGRRAARLPGHGRDSARKVRGMEVALVDRAVQLIGSLEVSDQRQFQIMVAGPAALIVTKLHKLGERFQARDRVQQKDALDIFRMLRALPTEKLVSVFQLLLEDPLSQSAAKEGVSFMSELFITPDSPGTLLVGDALEGLEDRAVICQ
jgi:hypothetical protein